MGARGSVFIHFPPEHCLMTVPPRFGLLGEQDTERSCRYGVGIRSVACLRAAGDLVINTVLWEARAKKRREARKICICKWTWRGIRGLPVLYSNQTELRRHLLAMPPHPHPNFKATGRLFQILRRKPHRGDGSRNSLARTLPPSVQVCIYC